MSTSSASLQRPSASASAPAADAAALWRRAAELRRLPVAGDPLLRARALTFRAVATYWENVCQRFGQAAGMVRAPLPAGTLPDAASAAAGELGRMAAGLPEAHAAYLLSSLYASLLPEEVRSAQGVFFTPPPLVERMLDLVERQGFEWERGTVLDPAAGGGAFLAPVAVRMAARLRRAGASPLAVVSHVASHVSGLEIDPFSAWLSQVLLEAALFEHCAASGARLPTLVLVADALQTPDGWEGGFDLVIGNPPYGRTRLAPEQRARFARTLYGHANLYGLFTDLAVRLVKPGGLIGFVTPTSFLGGKYFKNLRRFLADAAPPAAVDFVEDRSDVFEGVLQETLLVVYAAGGPKRGVNVSAIRSRGPDAACEVSPVAIAASPAAEEGPWVLPRNGVQGRMMDVIGRLPTRLADYGLRVSTGPLVWNRHKLQLRRKPGKETYPLVWAEAILPDGSFRFQATRRNHLPFFALEDGQEHLLVHSPCVLVQRTTAKEQHRRLIAAVLPETFLAEHGGAVVENHLNMVRPVNGAPAFGLRTIAVLLNAPVVDQVFRCISGSVAVSAFELDSLPLPGRRDMEALESLVEGGAGREAVERHLASVYGVCG